jgi:hypothetical protein
VSNDINLVEHSIVSIGIFINQKTWLFNTLKSSTGATWCRLFRVTETSLASCPLRTCLPAAVSPAVVHWRPPGADLVAPSSKCLSTPSPLRTCNHLPACLPLFREQFCAAGRLHAALQLLVRLMQSRYSCSLQEDEAALQQQQQQQLPRLAAAVLARVGEKRVLAELAQVC